MVDVFTRHQIDIDNITVQTVLKDLAFCFFFKVLPSSVLDVTCGVSGDGLSTASTLTKTKIVVDKALSWGFLICSKNK